MLQASVTSYVDAPAGHSEYVVVSELDGRRFVAMQAELCDGPTSELESTAATVTALSGVMASFNQNLTTHRQRWQCSDHCGG